MSNPPSLQHERARGAVRHVALRRTLLVAAAVTIPCLPAMGQDDPLMGMGPPPSVVSVPSNTPAPPVAVTPAAAAKQVVPATQQVHPVRPRLIPSIDHPDATIHRDGQEPGPAKPTDAETSVPSNDGASRSQATTAVSLPRTPSPTEAGDQVGVPGDRYPATMATTPQVPPTQAIPPRPVRAVLPAYPNGGMGYRPPALPPGIKLPPNFKFPPNMQFPSTAQGLSAPLPPGAIPANAGGTYVPGQPWRPTPPQSAPMPTAAPSPEGTARPSDTTLTGISPSLARAVDSLPPALAETVPSRPLRQAQIALIIKGYDPGGATGWMSADTIRALRAFQEEHHIAVTGTMDKATLIGLGIAAK